MKSASIVIQKPARHASPTLFGWPLSALCLALVLIVLPRWSAALAQEQFTFDHVIAKARETAASPYQDRRDEIPEFLRAITYDQYREIRFRTDQSLWRDAQLPFEVQFFHPGLFYHNLVTINAIGPEGVQGHGFSSDMFNYGSNDFASKIPPDFGFAGFRLHYPINRGDHRDEVVVFLGASYFRALGKGQVYGLSARGLAIDTGLDSGEEFPYFKEFWLERPDRDARAMVIHALLDSPSLSGAYRFSIHPGTRTEMTVEGILFPRRKVRKLGIAPLTSMFFYGENTNQRPVDDFRPEVHDSDGLLVANASGERVWRPLVNRPHLFINAFQANNPAGFGLMQRDREFDHYQDQEARYDLRPSAWVTPIGDWGAGHVELVQIPTDSEKNDNIVAYWVPEQLPEEQKRMDFNYRLSWYLPGDDPEGLGRVAATRTAAGQMNGVRRLIIDFQGGKLERLPDRLPAESPLEAMVSVGKAGEIVEKQLYRIASAASWRLVLHVRRQAGAGISAVLPDPISKPPPIEVRAYLRQDQTVMTETWSYAIWP